MPLLMPFPLSHYSNHSGAASLSLFSLTSPLHPRGALIVLHIPSAGAAGHPAFRQGANYFLITMPWSSRPSNLRHYGRPLLLLIPRGSLRLSALLLFYAVPLVNSPQCYGCSLHHLKPWAHLPTNLFQVGSRVGAAGGAYRATAMRRFFCQSAPHGSGDTKVLEKGGNSPAGPEDFIVR
jgi:hypothetical protein